MTSLRFVVRPRSSARSPTNLATRSCGSSPNGRTASPTRSPATSRPVWPASGRLPSRRPRKGWEGSGVTAFREASTVAAAALDYDAAEHWIGEGVRYADSIEQSHCAHVMRSTQAMVSWAGADLVDAAATREPGDRRQGLQPRARTWRAGRSATSRWPAASSTRPTTELEAALAFGTTSEEIELILPPLWGLAEVALQAGDPQRAFELCREALARAAAVDERVLLVPFVVTGVRAAQQAGRPVDAAAWMADCTDRLGSIPDVAAAALDHGRGLVAMADGATGVARLALESAVAGWDRHGRAWESAWARVDLAQCLVRSNRFAEAITFGVEARAAADRLGSPVLAERAEAVLRMARGPRPRRRAVASADIARVRGRAADR